MLRATRYNPLDKLLCGLACAVLSASASAATTDLADAPIGTTIVVPANVILDLSVEFPTAVTDAYFTSTKYSPTVPLTGYTGYFNPDFCYDYVKNTTYTAAADIQFGRLNGYFQPKGSASTHVCTGHWSGNFLNWIMTQTIDPLRKAMTGGARIVDKSDATILQKAYQDNQGGGSNQAVKKVTDSTVIKGATPFDKWTAIYVNNSNTGLDFVFSQTSIKTSDTSGTSFAGVSVGSINNTGNSTAYQAQSAVQVCDTDATSDLETAGGRCRKYGSNYKPVGLMQKYAAESTLQKDSIRYSIFGYLQDASGSDANQRLDGGVMRAKMKSVGPLKANPGSAVSTNTDGAEWDAKTGIFVTNPNPADATATLKDSSDPSGAVSNSGVMNYLNKFGFAQSASASVVSAYKRYDSVSELYYMATRYYRGMTNLSSHTPNATSITLSEATNDNFPVITSWDDPIKYTCSPNYIVGIGDQHTWNDGNVPGSKLNGGFEVADAQVTADTVVNAETATNFIGNLENIAGYTGAGIIGSTTANNGNDVIQVKNLGDVYANSITTCCNGNTYYMAGLAYDVHTRDIRPEITTKSKPITVSTFWLDVMEGSGGGEYHEKNQFWMTAKYGGFDTSNTTVFPGGYSEYGQTAALPTATWNTAAYIDDHNNYAPDQYFQAGNPPAMTKGLDSAFAKIAASVPTANSTALDLTTKNVTAGESNYAASYNTVPKDPWSGDLVGSSITFNADGTETETEKWHARDWLPNKQPVVTGVTELTATTRIIATSLSVGAAKGVPFAIGSLSSTEKSSLDLSGSNNTTVETNILNYVRGDQTNESTTGLRPRVYTLGDITNSKPVAISKPSMPYSDAPLNPGYNAFITANATRQKVVYVGANDGMMHAFDGTTDGSTTTGGKELFAYVPSFLFNTDKDSNGNFVGLASLAVNPLQHHFMVDTTPTLTDVDFARSGVAGVSAATASNWHSMLISGLGKGGKGYFALDVTNPLASSESALATNVLWEMSPSTMGYSYGEPTVVKTAKYGWTVVMTSGYNNSDGQGYFYLVNPIDGSVLETIPTNAGTTDAPAGLAEVSAFVQDNADFTADTLYAGDLQGNLWRVDLTTTAGLSATKIATLKDKLGNVQPVTTRPVIQVDPATGTRYVFVGTGQLLADTDLVTSNQQTFYAFIDGTLDAFDPSLSATRTDLADDSGTADLSGVSLTGEKGFFIDLAVNPASAGLLASAERVDVQPTATTGAVAFAANLVGQDVCSDGSSRVFALNFNSGVGAIGSSLLIDSAGGALGSMANTSSTPGKAAGVITDLSFVSVNGTLQLYSGSSTNLLNSYTLKPGLTSGLQKLNWREIPSSN